MNNVIRDGWHLLLLGVDDPSLVSTLPEWPTESSLSIEPPCHAALNRGHCLPKRDSSGSKPNMGNGEKNSVPFSSFSLWMNQDDGKTKTFKAYPRRRTKVCPAPSVAGFGPNPQADSWILLSTA